MLRPRQLLAAVLVGWALAATAGCAGSSSKPSAPGPGAPLAISATSSSRSAGPANPAAATAAVTADWEAFFATKKPAYLEHGAQFGQALSAFAGSPVAAQTTARVHQVSFPDANHATVGYDIVVAGVPALANQNGTAVLEAGTWKVSDATFCQLVSLQGGAPGCPAAHS